MPWVRKGAEVPPITNGCNCFSSNNAVRINVFPGTADSYRKICAGTSIHKTLVILVSRAQTFQFVVVVLIIPAISVGITAPKFMLTILSFISSFLRYNWHRSFYR